MFGELDFMLVDITLENVNAVFDKDVLDAISSGTIHPILYSLIKGIATQLAYVKLYDVTGIVVKYNTESPFGFNVIARRGFEWQ